MIFFFYESKEKNFQGKLVNFSSLNIFSSRRLNFEVYFFSILTKLMKINRQTKNKIKFNNFFSLFQILQHRCIEYNTMNAAKLHAALIRKREVQQMKIEKSAAINNYFDKWGKITSR